MYGMINRAFETFICNKYGKDQWETIKIDADLKLENDEFITMEQYPDDITFKLISSTATVLKASPNQIMEQFGYSWIVFASNEGYGDLLKLSGSTLFDCLKTLDNLHARLSLSFIDLKPPTFWCSDMSKDTVNLHYLSSRDVDLSYFVLGLLHGLSEFFQTQLKVDQIAFRAKGDDHDIFRCEIITI
jgi:hypothetical protein